MAKLPISTTAVEVAIENYPIEPSLPRYYLGISQLGHECPRYLWYYFRWAFKEHLTPRKVRIFERGTLEEERILTDLKKIGCTISDTQTEIVIHQHIRGHCDGIAHNLPDGPLPHVLEIKTMKQSAFTALKKLNSVEKANFKYYCQLIAYIDCLDCEWGLFIVTNKDTEERYYERVAADPGLAAFLIEKGLDIIAQEVPPSKLNNSPSWFECRWCTAKEICHYGQVPEQNCRTCQHVSSKHEKGWYCTKHDNILTEDAQKAGCSEYAQLEVLSR